MGWLGDNSGACCVGCRGGAGRLMRGNSSPGDLGGKGKQSYQVGQRHIPGGRGCLSDRNGYWVWQSPAPWVAEQTSDAVFPEPGWVAGSVLFWLSLSPAAAFSSTRDSGWDGLIPGAAVHLWGVWKPKIPREPAPQGSPLSRYSTHAPWLALNKVPLVMLIHCPRKEQIQLLLCDYTEG